MRKPKAVISQPMRGRTEAEIREAREPVVCMLKDKGYDVIDTVFPDITSERNVSLKYLAKTIEHIADADMVFFMKGWETICECNIEHNVCCKYGIDMQYESYRFGRCFAYKDDYTIQ